MAAVNFDVTGTIAMTDSAAQQLVAGMALDDVVAMTDGIDLRSRLLFSVDDAIAVSDAATLIKFMVMAIENGIGVESVLAAAGRFGMNLTASAKVTVVIAAGDELYNGWIVNPNIGASAGLEGFNFNSFARHKGKNYAIGRNGIYKMGGATDDGQKIDAFIGLPKLAFGTAHQKRIPHVYIGAASTGKMVLRVVVDGKAYTYMAVKATPNMAEQKVDLGKGLKGNYWQFELTNEDGADFDIDTIKFMPIVLERRV